MSLIGSLYNEKTSSKRNTSLVRQEPLQKIASDPLAPVAGCSGQGSQGRQSQRLTHKVILQDRSRSARLASFPTVGIVEAHDIVLAEIGAGLHLDDFERRLAWIRQPMRDAQWDVGRLIFRQQ